MEHEAAREFVNKVATLWKAQHSRAFLYKEALQKDNIGPLRQTLSQGYFSALLFQKEIQGIYDYVKCLFTDEDLGNQNAETVVSNQLENVEEGSQIVKHLMYAESAVLLSYKSMENHLEYVTEVRHILTDHLERISEFYKILSKYQHDHYSPVMVRGAA
ncbi:MAG TPA: hypothetical protein VGN64_11060 [Dyadobacter sp.]|jgi:hypothetical protein|nr:hypothetical protein [Dyadobacter sp.]